jgi:hypothetical protein
MIIESRGSWWRNDEILMKNFCDHQNPLHGLDKSSKEFTMKIQRKDITVKIVHLWEGQRLS